MQLTNNVKQAAVKCFQGYFVSQFKEERNLYAVKLNANCDKIWTDKVYNSCLIPQEHFNHVAKPFAQ